MHAGFLTQWRFMRHDHFKPLDCLMMHNRNYFAHWIALQFLAFILQGCGGGGASTPDIAAPGADTTVVHPPAPVIAPSTGSVARRWNEVLLQMIRSDRARPPVHARNLFHVSAAMYDAWAAFDKGAATYLLGSSLQGFSCPMPLPIVSANLEQARAQAISFAAYRLIKHRYNNSSGFSSNFRVADQLMSDLGLDARNTSVAAANSSPIELGNHIANCYINFGLQDGSNEAKNYVNQFYKPVNISLNPANPGNPFISNLDRWQPLDLAQFVDQGGTTVLGGGAEFVGAEWGRVFPFALSASQKTVYSRSGVDYPVYYDPGRPPSFYDSTKADFEWSFLMVAKWGAHLDPADRVTMDISPAAIGNASALPLDMAGHRSFYSESGGVSKFNHGKAVLMQLVR